MSNSVSCLCTRHNDRNKSCNTSPRWICISPPKFKEKSSILFSNISDFVSVSYEQHVRSQPAKTSIDFSPNRLPRKKNPGTNSVLENYNSIKKLQRSIVHTWHELHLHVTGKKSSEPHLMFSYQNIGQTWNILPTYFHKHVMSLHEPRTIKDQMLWKDRDTTQN